MATGKITKRTLDALQAGAVTGFLWDDELKGFGLKISASGSASYVVQYRMGGREAKTRRYTIGGHGSPWTPFTAREEATRLLRLVDQGIDPVESDKQRRREAVDLAFSNYADRFAASCKGNPDFDWLASDPKDFLTRPGGWPETRYEAKARRLGHEVWYFRYVRI